MFHVVHVLFFDVLYINVGIGAFVHCSPRRPGLQIDYTNNNNRIEEWDI
jgi:hypothetical protein